ncbi:MAG TPA: MOSC domain-containing protein [Phycisphaerales bacterium]|nr:MOSC domain-containing protein [Phycisphaerales bacterium]
MSSVRAVPGRGLEGDRYFLKAGTFTKPDAESASNELTLIESEALSAIQHEYQIALEPALSRRNILTVGVPLNHLVNRTFTVGNVLCKGLRLCEPCSHLEKLTIPGVKKALTHRGGLRAQILTEGVISSGDVICPADAAPDSDPQSFISPVTGIIS